MKTQLGHYEIVAELGRGGMGVVYKGYEPALNRFVAIKELSPSLAHDANLVERFLREARSMAVLNDPHIIQVYFIGTDEATGQPFFAMEFVEGDSLSGLLKRDGKLSVENALKLMQQAAQGLASAHDKGVIHRDIKPGNLMITPRGHVKIADFGIALATQDFSKKLTSTGEFVGTPGYLSPEVCLGKTVDQRSDIFALGIVLYEMLAGRLPFTDESPLGLMLEVVKAEIPDIRNINNAVDPQCAEILARMLAKDPADRFQDCHALAEALQAHPLVARGGTVNLSLPKPAPADATMVSVSTPASLAQRQATPPPVVRSTPSPASAVAASVIAPPTPPVDDPTRPVNPRPSVLDRQESRRGSRAGLIAAAAVLVLLLGMGLVFRGAIGEFLVRSDDPATAAVPDASSAPASAVAPLAASTVNATGGDAAAAPTTPSATGNVAASTAPTAPTATSDNNLASSAVEVAGAGTTPVEQESTAIAGNAAEPSGAAAAPVGPLNSAGPVTTGSALAKALRNRREQASASPQRELAAPAVATPPRVAVIALGDRALADAARQRIEERLMAEGFDVLDTSLVSGIDDRDDLPRLFNTLRREATAVVVVRAEPLGSQQLNFYGQSSTLYSANLSVRAYDIAGKRPLGAGFREKVDFTTLNLDANTGIAVQPHLGSMVSELSPYRPRRAAG